MSNKKRKWLAYVLIIIFVGCTISLFIYNSPLNIGLDRLISFFSLNENKSSFLILSAKVIGTFIAILIPLSFNIISNSSRLYNDTDIAKIFKKEVAYVGLLVSTFTLLLLIFFLIYFEINLVFTNYLAFILSIVALIFLFWFIRLIARYSTQTEDIILDWTEKSYKEILSPHNEKRDVRELLHRTTPKIVNSFKRKIETEQIDAATTIIDISLNRLNSYIKLATINPEKYNLLLYQKKVYNRLNDNQKKEMNPYVDYNLFPGIKHFGGLIHDLWKIQIKYGKIDLANHSILGLRELLIDLTSKPGNMAGLLVILETLRKISQTSLKNDLDYNYQNSGMATFSWYKTIRFSDKVRTEYYEELDRYFIKMIKYVVDSKNEDFFKYFVRDFAGYPSHGPPIVYKSIIVQKFRDFYSKKLSEYLKNIPEIQREELLRDFSKIFNIEKTINRIFFLFNETQVENWEEEIDEIYKVTIKNRRFINFSEEEIEDEKKSILEKGKGYCNHNNFLLIMIGIGSYCFAKGHYNWCFYLLDYNQPINSSKTRNFSLCHPVNFFDVSILLSNFNSLRNKMDSIMDKGSIDLYLKQYFLILYTHIQGFKKSQDRVQEKYFGSTLENFNIQELVSLRTSFHEFLSEGLFNDFKNNNSLLKELKATTEWVEKVLWQDLYGLSKSTNEHIDQFIRRSKVDSKLVEVFRENTFTAFFEKGILRNILLRYSKKIYNLSSPKSYTSTSLERNSIGKKNFITVLPEHWELDGKSIGSSLAEKENKFLFQLLLNHSIKSEIGLKDWLEENQSNIEQKIIIARNVSFYDFSDLSETDSEDWEYATENEERDFKFKGKYKDKLEVYCISDYDTPKTLIIMDKEEAGVFVQYSPSQSRLGDIEVFERKDSLLGYKLDFYSDDRTLLEKEIENPTEEKIFKLSEYEEIKLLEPKTKLRFQTKVEFRPLSILSSIHIFIE